MDTIHKSGEDYLEAALFLEREKGYIKSIDIANRLGVSRASVSKGLDVLMQNDYVFKESYGDIHLTEKGREKAEEVACKHLALKTFLEQVLNVSKETAEADACLIEHVLSEETSKKLLEYVKKNLK